MSDDQFAKGEKVRREVLSDAHVDRSLSKVNDFNRPIIDYITKYAWGDVWARPGLERKTRSILNLGMLAALGREAELKVHIKGALRNGVTKEEISEIFLQVAVYCGAPASLEAFRVAEEVFEAEGV
jgi:4-carboxymuconolactone decarboxylase